MSICFQSHENVKKTLFTNWYTSSIVYAFNEEPSRNSYVSDFSNNDLYITGLFAINSVVVTGAIDRVSSQ